ncbi:MAG: zinc-ribbon domain-containing protein [Paludibacteraceae bacterium]
MICPNCEKEIADNIAQCEYCGCHFPVREIPRTEPKKSQSSFFRQENTSPTSKQREAVVPPVTEQERPKQAASETDKGTTSHASKICPHCGKPIASTAMFCRFCGNKVSPAEEVPDKPSAESVSAQPDATPTPAPETTQSSKPEQQEGADVHTDNEQTQLTSPDSHTTEVTEKAAPAARFCKHCGKPIAPTAMFCKFCGNKVSPAEEKAQSRTQGGMREYSIGQLFSRYQTGQSFTRQE